MNDLQGIDKEIFDLFQLLSDFEQRKFLKYLRKLKSNKENGINVKFPSDVPEDEQQRITKNLENTIDEYLKIMNIKSEDKENEKR